ncbi:MAG TPA: NlpC/P60 family protein [Nocardioides sp.]|jgi:cell wall-associated NlpC family hydrolase|nr:NlpC/P60 family protein [Nocardioides sp.]
MTKTGLRLVSAPIAPLWRGPTGSARDDRVTEALAGEPLLVTGEPSQGRIPVVAPWQPSSLATNGYPGWVDAHRLGDSPSAAPALAVASSVLPHDSDDPVDLARHLLGTPYVWGGLSAEGIDCSGLVHLVHRELRRIVPRDARDQGASLAPVPLTDVRRGDLYLFARPGRSVHHVAFVVEPSLLGPGVVLHASDGDGGVVEGPLDAERTATLAGAARAALDLR